MLKSQTADPSTDNYGGIPNTYQLFNPGSTAAFVRRSAVALVSPGSPFFKDSLLVQKMEAAMDFLQDRQHEDGTIDLLTTNFHSTPDLGFVVEPLALSYKVLDKNKWSGLEPLLNKLRDFLLKGAEALSRGGIHTPNHRWVVSMALARINELFPNEKYTERINEWLNEGIDIDPDGQYTERSTAVYSPLTDRCLITIARLADKPALFDPVRKNLDMTIYYIHPNGEIATEASRRQDQYLARTPVRYLYPYLFMSLRDKNSQFGSIVDLLKNNLSDSQLSDDLIYFLEDSSLINNYPTGDLPNDYRKHFPHSELVRIRRNNYDATVLAKNSTLFTFQNDKAVLQAVRMATAFFGKGQFIADTLIDDGDKIILTQHLEGPYYQPIADSLISADGNWEKMPRNKRPQSEIQKMEYRLEVTEVPGGFSLKFNASGTDHVPVAIEISLRKGGKLNGVDAVPDIDDSYFLKNAKAVYTADESGIFIIGARQEHDWTQLRGAEDKVEGLSIYVTGYTPFEHTMFLRAE